MNQRQPACTGTNYAFIDNHNVYKETLRCGWRIDWLKFRRFLQDKFDVARAFQFLGYLPEKRALYTALEHHGYDLIFREVVRFGDDEIKANIDSWLIVECLKRWGHFQQATIVAGDGDYLPLLETLQEQNKLDAIWTPSVSSTSYLLRPFSNHFFNLNRYRRELEFVN